MHELLKQNNVNVSRCNKRAMPSCIVWGCSSCNKKIGLHKLFDARNDTERLRKWLDVIGNSAMTLEEADFTRSHRFVVEELHFSDANLLQCDWSEEKRF